jgi:hypothetical protein
MCHLAEESITRVLDGDNNAAHLLDMHRPQRQQGSFADTTCNVRSIRIK